MSKLTAKTIKTLIATIIISAGAWAVLSLISPLRLAINTITIPQNEPFSVTAEASNYVKPDIAEINLQVIKEGYVVSQLTAQINDINNKLIAKLKELGIKEEDIKTTNYSINPRYAYENTPNINGYTARASLLVRTENFDLLNQILTEAAALGINDISGPNFIVKEKDAAVAKARAEAIQKAKTKAQAIAQESGLSLGRLLNVNVQEAGDSIYPSYYESAMNAYGGKGGGSPDIQAGQNEIKVIATVVYEVK